MGASVFFGARAHPLEMRDGLGPTVSAIIAAMTVKTIRTAVQVVYQGEPGAYSEEAALVLFPGASTSGPPLSRHSSLSSRFSGFASIRQVTATAPV